MRRVVLVAAAAVAEGGDVQRDALLDANRLRRMDRFGRSGVLAGARALAAAGVEPAAPGAGADPRFGVVVGTAYGCRDAVTQHERLLAAAARTADLAPSVFVATVHNAVCGELAILYGLGGPAETIVSGSTAGLEALALAASRVAKGDADRILVVAAEGIDAPMRSAFARENPGATLVESSAAVLLEGREEEEISSSEWGAVVFGDASLTFETPALRDPSEERPGDSDFFEGVGRAGAGARGGAAIERLGVTGLWEIAQDLEAARASSAQAAPSRSSSPSSPFEEIRKRRYVARDAHGARCAVTLEFFS